MFDSLTGVLSRAAEEWNGMAKKDSEKTETEGGAVETTDSPLLDLSDAAVKRMIKPAKKRGFVTYAELNAVLPSEEVNSEQIEDILAMLNEMGINVVETEEHEEGESRGSAPRKRKPKAANSSRSRSRRPSPADRPSRPIAPTIRCACICARWARSSFCRARAKSPSPSASRLAARR